MADRCSGERLRDAMQAEAGNADATAGSPVALCVDGEFLPGRRYRQRLTPRAGAPWATAALPAGEQGTVGPVTDVVPRLCWADLPGRVRVAAEAALGAGVAADVPQ